MCKADRSIPTCRLAPRLGEVYKQIFDVLNQWGGAERVLTIEFLGPHPASHLFCASYKLCRTLLSDIHHFGQAFSTTRVAPHESGKPPLSSYRDFAAAAMGYRSGGIHRVQRDYLAAHFSRKAVHNLRPETNRLASTLLSNSCHPEFDFANEFSYPLALRMIMELIGMDAKDYERIRQWSKSVALPHRLLTTIDNHRQAKNGFKAFSSYLSDWLNSESTTALGASLRMARDRLSLPTLVADLLFLIVAGHETTAHTLSNMINQLSVDSECYKQITNDPRLARAAVNEILRLEPGIQLVPREVASPTILGGYKLEIGQKITVFLAGANRDPSIFNDPDSFKLARPSDNLAFSWGPHICLGQHLARVILEEGLLALIDQYPTLPPLVGQRVSDGTYLGFSSLRFA